MPLDRRRGGSQMMMRGNFLRDYVRSLGAVLFYDGTLRGTDIKNWGTGGATQDGTPQDITIAKSGMDFNGDSSLIEMAANAAVSDLTAYTYAMVFQADTQGEGTTGRLWNWSNQNYLGNVQPGSGGATTFLHRVQRATTAAQTTFTNFIPSMPSNEIFTCFSWDGTDISGHAANKGDSALTAGSNSNGAGTVFDLTSQSLFIGNRELEDRGFDGRIKYFMIFNRVLTPGERSEVAQVAGIIPFR